MGNFRSDRGNRSGGDRTRSSYGGRSSGGFGGRSGGFGGRSESRGGFGRDRDRGFGSERRPHEMHDVTCDKCGKQCQVPFRPSGDKPVLCSDCFKNSGSATGSSQSGVSSEQLNQINSKLDKILLVLQDLELDVGDDSEDKDDDEDEDEDEEEDEAD